MMAGWQPGTEEIGLWKPRLREGLCFTPQEDGPELTWTIGLPASGKYYQVSARDYELVSLFNGNTSVAGALTILARTGRDSVPTLRQAAPLVHWLLETGIAVLPGSDPLSSGTANSTRASSWFNPLWIRIPLPVPVRLLDVLAQRLAWIFSWPGFLLGIALIAVGISRLVQHQGAFSNTLPRMFSRDLWWQMIIVWVTLKLLHELSHALVCRKYGGVVRDWGVVLAAFVPTAYVDVTSSWSFLHRGQRIHTALAGIWTEMLIAGAAACLFDSSRTIEVQTLLVAIISSAGVSTILFNMNPLMRFDGYFVLCDLLRIPNLATQSGQVWTRLATRWIFGHGTQSCHETGWRYGFVVIYGVLAGAWRCVTYAVIGLTLSALFSGAGLGIVVMALLAGIVVPMLRGAWQMISAVRHDPIRLVWGGAKVCLLLFLVVMAMDRIPWPAAVTAHGVVVLGEGDIHRAPAKGFIHRLMVEDGDTVEAGQVLVELVNDELESEVADLELQIHQAGLRRRIAMEQQKHGLVAIEEERRRSLTTRFYERSRQLKSLVVRSNHAGEIVARTLKERIGTSVDEGAELLVVRRPLSQEFLAVVAQHDFPVLQPQPTHCEIRMSGAASATGRVASISPVAVTTGIPEQLYASQGGPLAVVEASQRKTPSSAEWQLGTPHFLVRVALPLETASHLKPGQRGYIPLGFGGRTIRETAQMQLGLWSERLRNIAVAADRPSNH